jgi:hypothetical protein
MFSLLFLAAAASVDPALSQPIWRCTAQHYSAFVSPSGTTAKWPVVRQLPKHLKDQSTMLLATSGALPGGKAHVMYIDPHAAKVYVLQTAGTPGTEVIFGPLPPVACPPAPADDTAKPAAPKGAA